MIIWLSHLPFVVVVVLGVGSPGTRIRKRETGEGEGGKKSSCCFVSGGFIVPERYFSISLSLLWKKNNILYRASSSETGGHPLSAGLSILFSCCCCWMAKERSRIRVLLLLLLVFFASQQRRSKTSRRSSVHSHTVQSYTYTLCVCVCVSFLWSFSCCVRICQSNNSSRRMTRRNFYLFL